ncbi:MAG: hypothetical protein GY816_04080 [Cytophagales bacterium]|nr:hypothetical protein [Cytophagales bacterium]
MSFVKFKYNSQHKLITALLVIFWVIFQFSGRSESQRKYENGQIKQVGTISNGLNEGQWIWYYENGQKELAGSFIKGKREGQWNSWDSSGNLLSETTYTKDQLNGECLRWNSEGELLSREYWKSDKRLSSSTN